MCGRGEGGAWVGDGGGGVTVVGLFEGAMRSFWGSLWVLLICGASCSSLVLVVPCLDGAQVQGVRGAVGFRSGALSQRLWKDIYILYSCSMEMDVGGVWLYSIHILDGFLYIAPPAPA